MTTLDDIRDFLDCRRLAVVGVSRNPRDFSRKLFRDLRRRGYQALPVNPAVAEIDGVPCYPRIADVPAPVDGVLLMTSPAVTERVVEECARAGVRRVWMYRAGGSGAVSEQAVRYCQEQGMRLIAGECPYMFLPAAGWEHRAHGLFRKLTGRYPRVA